ncbi:hypothetical protein PIB30_066791 [Stylosanthes scabra]|uniref:ADP-ribosyl cyclase/cyclic ADP-ribose hydrolase n=1 Tax=Stylosanthes scabra TaxID=79078 RepID=A0ABU6YL99_9FABA|nr:hypothetical protein [Stylosanthes scabra]
MLKNVREESQKFGVASLRDKLVNGLLPRKSLVVEGSSNTRSTFYEAKLSKKKIFIVLDDMDKFEQFEHLATQWSGPGSRIIITARDNNVLRKVHGIYEVQGLSFKDSSRLFCLNAFDKIHPEAGYEEISKMAVSYANGIPLALKVLGRFLYSKTREQWESALEKLKIYPDTEIFNVLKLNYDGLDDLESEIFLEIAFFYKGKDKYVIIQFLELCGFFPDIGIDNPSRRALITISDDDNIGIHDLIEQMGREIVRQESTKDPGRRSRLSNLEEVYDVLNNNKGTDSVEGIILDLSQLKRDLHLDVDTFKKMPNISQVSKLWDGVQDLVNLRRINLKGCKQLVELPDFTKASNLKKIDLMGCESLCELPPSILSIHKLQILDLENCKALKSLKSNIHFKSLKWLSVLGCSSLKEFSVSSEQLTMLELHETIIDKLHPSVGYFSKLKELKLTNLKLKALPDELCHLVSLEKLDLYGCEQLVELPRNMKALSRLQDLDIMDCCNLGSLPELPPSIIHFSATNCTSLEKLFNAKAVLSLNLVTISFENCVRLEDDSFLEYVHHPMMGVAMRAMTGGTLQYKYTGSHEDDVRDYVPGSDRKNHVFFPGSKVPPWFKYQTRESSVSFDLFADKPCYIHTLVGFILCCVVHYVGPSQTRTTRVPFDKWPPVVECGCDLWRRQKVTTTSRLSSDHVCIWFEGVGSKHQLRDKNVTFKFEANSVIKYHVYTRAWYDECEFQEWEVIGCGVCPVYASDIFHVFQNVDPQFHFFYDKRSHPWQRGVKQTVFTVEEEKLWSRRSYPFYWIRRKGEVLFEDSDSLDDELSAEQFKEMVMMLFEDSVSLNEVSLEQMFMKMFEISESPDYMNSVEQMKQSVNMDFECSDCLHEVSVEQFLMMYEYSLSLPDEISVEQDTDNMNQMSRISSGSEEVPQSLDEQENQSVQSNNSPRSPSWQRFAHTEGPESSIASAQQPKPTQSQHHHHLQAHPWQLCIFLLRAFYLALHHCATGAAAATGNLRRL